jgi:hypothetical protein
MWKAVCLVLSEASVPPPFADTNAADGAFVAGLLDCAEWRTTVKLTTFQHHLNLPAPASRSRTGKT